MPRLLSDITSAQLAIGRGTITTGAYDKCCKLVCWNESIYSLKLTFADNSTALLPAWTARKFEMRFPSPFIQWEIYATLDSS
jgi:hypothetical protein